MGQMPVWLVYGALWSLCMPVTYHSRLQGKNRHALLHGIWVSNLPETSKVVQHTSNNGIFLLTLYDGPLGSTP